MLALFDQLNLSISDKLSKCSLFVIIMNVCYCECPLREVPFYLHCSIICFFIVVSNIVLRCCCYMLVVM